MKNKAMKKLCFALSMALTITSIPFGTAATVQAKETEALANAGAVSLNGYGLAQKVEDGTILHCWCWNFNTIKEKMPEIAAAGFSSVQTSPICQVLVGDNGGLEIIGEGKWYYHYQPTDYVVGNYQLGTEEEFKEMCTEAHKYGIKVIVDSVLNHCTSDYASISDNIKNLEGGAFHEMNRPEGQNWSETDRYEETQYDLSGLYELNTQNKNVQNYILTFLKNCVNDGADGFRYDAAKLIELPDDTSAKYGDSFRSDFWPTILQNGASFQYGEVLQEGGNHTYKNSAAGYDDGDSSRLAAYQSQTYTYQGETHHMNTTNSFTGFRIRDAVTSKNLTASFVDDFLLPSGASEERVVTWVESHDNYCNDSTYAELDRQQVIQAWAVIAARKGGTPLFFDRPNNSTASSPWGDNKIGPEGSDMYKDAQVVAVNFFRNEMGDSDETITNPVTDSKEVVMIERGTTNKGCVIVNVSDEDVALDAATGMADGTYTDQVYGGSFTVSGGKLSGTVKAGTVAVVYNPQIDESGKSSFEPAVTLSVPEGYFLSDKLEVGVSVRGCASATYQIDDNAAVACKDGDVITIGEELAVDADTTLKVTGYDSDGNQVAAATATYTKRKAKGTTIAYFNKGAQPDWEDVYVYVYAGGGKSNAGWPGVKAEKISGNLYKYVLPFELEALEDCTVIFNSGKGSQLPDKAIAPEKSMIYTVGGQWIEYDADAAGVELSKPTGYFQSTIQVILSISGCVSATYQLGNEAATACTDGDIVTIGTDMQEGDSVTLTLTGVDANDESHTTSATYTKRAYQKNTVVYIDPDTYPDWQNIYVHVYGGSVINKGWPGEKMDLDEETGYYRYILPYDLESINSNAIFNNGSGGAGNQTGDYPVNPGQTKLLTASGQWMDYTPGETVVDVAIVPGSSEFEDTIDVTMYAKGCTQANYQLGDDSSVSFNGITVSANNVKTITIGEDMEAGDEVTLTLTAVDAKGVEHTKTATYTKKAEQQGGSENDNQETQTVVYLDPQAPKFANGSWNKFYAYVWTDYDGDNGGWPGEEMQQDTDGLYYYVLPEKFNSLTGNVIFHNGSGTQFDAGAINGGQKMIWDSTDTWRSVSAQSGDLYDPDDLVEGVEVTEVSINGALVASMGWDNVYVYAFYHDGAIKNAAWPGVKLEADVNGDYSYELPDNLKSLNGVQVIFNNGSGGDGNQTGNVEVTPGKQATLTENGTKVEEIKEEDPAGQEEQQNPSGAEESEESKTAPVDISSAVVTLAQSTYTYDGSEKTPAVTVTVGGKTLTGADYTVAYANNTNAGTATVTITGKGDCTGTKVQSFTIEKAAKTIEVGNSVQKAYGAKAFSLGAKVTANEKLTYVSSDKKVATVNASGKVTIKGTGKATITIQSAASANYKEASAKVTLKVVPKKATLSSVKSKKSGQITVKWKKDAKATGYVITYSTKKNFKGAKTVTVKSNKTTSKTIKVSKGKKYYVKVTAYKTIDKKKAMGADSKAKTVTVMK